MKNAKNTRFLKSALSVVLLASLAGCMPNGAIEEDDEGSMMPELIALRRKADRLEKENKALTSKNAVLKARAKGLSNRAGKLSDKCNKLQLEADRRTAQVKVLEDLPAERDRFKAELEVQKARAEKLERELRKLKGK